MPEIDCWVRDGVSIASSSANSFRQCTGWRRYDPKCNVSIASSSANSFRQWGGTILGDSPIKSQSLLHQRIASGLQIQHRQRGRRRLSQSLLHQRIASGSPRSILPRRYTGWSQSLLHQRIASGGNLRHRLYPRSSRLNRFFISE